MPPDGLVSRSEFQGYVDRHDADEFAHAAMRHAFRNELVVDFMHAGKRLDDLERWQQRIIGAGAMLTFLVTAGVVGLVVELIRLAVR